MTTTTPPVKVVSSTSTTAVTVTMAPTSVGQVAALGQFDLVSATTPDLEEQNEGFLASLLCHSCNLSPRCPLRLIPIMSWVLHK